MGFNRRFSPHLNSIKGSLGSDSGVMNIIVTMNAGFVPHDHWVHDLSIGGGRIIGEACHLIDVCVYLTGSLVHSVCMSGMGKETDLATDNGSILLKFQNGSNAVVNYFSNGSKKYTKERVEVFSKEQIWIMDNYRKTESYGTKKFKPLKTKIDKGHNNQFRQLVNRTKHGGRPLISFEEIINVTKASFAAIQSLKEKKWVKV